MRRYGLILVFILAAGSAQASATPPLAEGIAGVAPDGPVTLIFAEPVMLGREDVSVECDTSGSHTVTVSGGQTSFALAPDVAFEPLETCLLEAIATKRGAGETQAVDGSLEFTVAAASSDYYAGVNTSSASALRSSLHNLIDDHQRYPYTASTTDTWDILEFADEDPEQSNRILDVYRNARYQKGTSDYNREHTWPKSYGFPDDGAGNYPYTDTHMLFLANAGYNSSRNNKKYGDCSGSCTEQITLVNFGVGGPGQSNWANSSDWQTWSGRKGDVARAQFYMDVRYEGGTHGGTGAAEPNLILTNDVSLIKTTAGNASVAYMGLLDTLIQWHQADPPDDKERLRNEAVYSYQGNRNPFIDHPEWVACVFQGRCS